MNLRGIWERVGIRPWRLAAFLVGFAIALFVVLPLARYSGMLESLGFTCDAQEKAALVEFPQYGGKVAGKDLDIYGDEVNFPPLQAPPRGCFLEFGAPQVSPQQVSAYYVEKLAEHGWTVKRFPVDREGEFEYPHLEGSRDGFRYVVHYFQLPGSEGTDIRVLVYRA